MTAREKEEWFLGVRVNKRKTCACTCVCVHACVFACVCGVDGQRSRAAGDSDGAVQGRRGDGDEWGEKSGEEDNLVQSVVDDLRKKGRRERHHQTTGERGGRERGRDWREREKDSITRQKESVVFSVLEERFSAEVESQAHRLQNLSPSRNELDLKKQDLMCQQTCGYGAERLF